MRPAILKTLPFPAAGNGVNPVVIASAASAEKDGVPLRVLVRNTGANGLALGYEVQDLVPAPGGAAFNAIPAGQEDVFVVMPGQTLKGVGVGGVTTGAVAVSEAFPIGRATKK